MGEGTISGVIRFICHLPFAFYAFTAISHFTFVKNHMGVLLAPPLGPRILVGETFAGPIGAIGFLWNFFLWIPTLRTEGGGLVLLGVVDAIITGFLIISLSIEASFMGFTYEQCAQLRQNATPSPHLIFFQRVAEINPEEDAAGQGTCQSYYMKWYSGLIVAILYAASATANILIGSSSRRSFGDRYAYNADRFSSNCLLAPVPPITYIIPARVQNSVFFARRYIGHWLSSKGFRTKHQIPNTYCLLPRHVNNTEGQEKGLPNLLSHEVVRRIAQKLHYVDVVSLSLTSKRIREALFPRQKRSTGEERQLRYYSCWGNKKSDCWVCGIQICTECSESKLCSKSTISFHISLCAAACSKCYYKTLSDGNDMRRPCSCNDGRKKGYTYSYGAQPNFPAERIVCRDCYHMTGDEALALRERRDQAVYSNLTQQPLPCSICLESLQRSGPRWWVCSSCKRECRSDCHLGWS
ncbi:hypothetical protein F4823DRAFT_616644 [Ustulina deusta]|nr:hypothetical protein F4823DRAFT_616644 [Ustulina deusta]